MAVTTPPEIIISEPPRPSLFTIIAKVLMYSVLIIWAVLVIFPMLWSIMTSFKTDQEIFFNPWALPKEWMYENFIRAWIKARMGDYLTNTLLIIIPALTLTLLLSAMASYVLARFEFKGRQLITYIFLLGMVFPIFLALVPLYFLMNNLKLLDTFPGLILVYVAYSLSFTTFFLTNFFRTLPRELGEAAVIDGANQYQIFFQVYFPLAQPGLLTMGIFNFIGQWNQYILPNMLMITNNDDVTHYVLSQGLYYLQSQQFYQNDWSGLFAAVTIVMVPTLVVYLIFHDRIEKGLTVGAVKG